MSNLHVIKMPDIGEGIVEVELVAWRVAPGEAVKEDQVLADVMTDKATVEIPSPVHGVVHSLGGEAGTVMRVGSALITIAREGAAMAAEGAAVPPAAPTSAPTPAPSPAVPASLAATTVASVAASVAVSAPAPQAVASAAETSAGAAISPPSGAAPANVAGVGRPIASPSVRRRAWELGVDLAQVRASGTAGRILHADVEAHAHSHPAAQAPGQGSPFLAPAGGSALAAASTAPQSPSERHLVQPRGEGIQAVKVMGLRRKIAQKMQESKRNIPHFSYVEECDVTELEALRERLNTRHGASRGKLTVLPLLVRALCRALRDFPQINARFDDEAAVVNRFEAVHLGVAAQTPSGLMVPVIRHAQALDLWSCASEIRRLADAARSGRATREELSGSTFTLSSLGPLGGIVTTPVINHPEVGILGVNRIVERPVMRGGQVVGRLMMNLSSSFDHRVVDGQDAAEFIQAIRAQIEAPATLFID